MEFLNRFDIRQENGGTTVVLYLNPQSTEFSSEFLANIRQERENVEEKIHQILKQKLPGVKAAAVKVMAGSLMIAAIPLYSSKASAHETDFNMSYIYFGNASTYVTYIDKTQGNLKVISPSFFNVNDDGSLNISPELTQAFVDEMHKKGVKVVPFLSNHWNRDRGRAALQNREKLAQEIAEVMKKYNLDGVNVDIENVTEVDKTNYTNLVKLLSETIPSEKEVSVAVAANPNGWTKGWHGSYDYNQLGKYADYLVIMAYDESYPGGPEGPVASLPWVKKSIDYAINQNVPRDKIVLGIPFFGRYWIEGESYGGDAMTNQRVEEMIDKYQSTVTFDEKTQSPKAVITIKQGDPPFKFSGKTLGPGTYHIWFENEQSIKAKVDLVHEYEIKGTGSWALGQEDPAIWNNFGVWLKGHGATADLTQPQEGSKPVEGSYFNYKVQAGDTLSAISERYGVTVNEIRVMNGLTSDIIKVGQTLKIPGQLENEQAESPTVPIVKGPRGEIGYINIKKAINLWKRDESGKLEFVRVLEPGERYRVYGVDSKYGGQFDVGGNHWVTNMEEHVTYDSLSGSTSDINNTNTKKTEITVRGTKGEIGHIKILKPINLWQRDSHGKLVYARVLKPGEVYRVYGSDDYYGGQYDVGGNHWITNMKGYVSYEPL